MECKIKDCNRKIIAKGWCWKHYNAWRKKGDPEAYNTHEKNTYRLEDRSVIIDLRDRSGIKVGEVIVDREDFDKVKELKWGTTKTCGYAISGKRTGLKTKNIFMHRLIMGEPATQVDHINRNKLDNRKTNLRLCSPGQNSRNRLRFSRSVTSNFIGVSLNRSTNLKRIWLVTAKFSDCNQIHWGRYETEEEAAYVRDQIVLQLGDRFSVLNFLEYD